MKVNIIGTIFGMSGYDRHTRELANACNEIGLDVRLDVPKIPQWERYCNDFEFKSIEKPFDPEATTIMISQPQTWRFGLAQKPSRFYGFLVWEGSHIPAYWIPYLMDERVNFICVPSNHTKLSIINTCADWSIINSKSDEHLKIIEKIVIIPHGFNSKIFYPDRKEKWKPFEDTFVMTANKGFSQGLYDRGGLQFLFQAFNEEFSNKDNIELRVHINPVYNNPAWNIDEELKKIGLEKREDRPKILVTTDLLDENALRRFYNEGNVFVSTSMADGFDLPCIEAMACGLPCLVTANNGHCDFVNEDNGWIIEEGEFVNWSKEIIYEETKWFKPDVTSIRRHLRFLFENQNSIQRMADKALEDVKNWTWKCSAEKLRRLLE